MGCLASFRAGYVRHIDPGFDGMTGSAQYLAIGCHRLAREAVRVHMVVEDVADEELACAALASAASAVPCCEADCLGKLLAGAAHYSPLN